MPDMVKLTSIAVAEGRNQGTGNHDDTADHNGGLSAQVIGHVGDDEEGDNGTNVVHVDEDSELIVVFNLGKVRRPLVHLLRRVDHHAIVAGGGRGNQQEDGEDVELAQVRLLVPGHLLEPGGSVAGGIEVGLPVGAVHAAPVTDGRQKLG